jgi:hypothetical protein
MATAARMESLRALRIAFVFAGGTLVFEGLF